MKGIVPTFLWVFVNRYGELRAGWRIVAFLVISSGISAAAIGAYHLSGLPHSELVVRILLLLAVLAGTWVMTRFVNRKPLSAVGLWLHDRTVREWGMGLLIGFLMMSGIFVVVLALGFLQISWREVSVAEAVLILGSTFLVFLLGAAFEEFLFRGYLFQTLMQGVTFLPAMVMMSGLFGLAHWNNPHATVLSTLNVFLAGVWLTFAYMKTRSLWLPTALHVAWNFAQSGVYGFATSGHSFSDRTLLHLQESGPAWITGGAFGPEGAILATVALIGGTWYVLKTRLLTTPGGIVTLDSLEDVLPASPGEGEQG